MSHRLPLAIALLGACAPSIEDLPLDDTQDPVTDRTDDEQRPGGDDTAPAVDDGPIVGPDARGVVTVLVDATSEEAWVHVDLDGAAFVGADGDWSLAFRRSVIQVNGGVSGDGGVEVAFTEDAFADVVEAPAAGWTADAPDADADGEPELALAGWYDYDLASHLLSPRPGTWFVRSAGGVTYAVEFLGYYDDAGTSGFPSFRYKPVDDPAADAPGGFTLTVDASDKDAWVYVDLDAADEVAEPAVPADDLSWDLALRRTSIRLNGGASGAGQGAAVALPDGTTWDEVTAAPEDGWAEDVAPAGPRDDGTVLGDWYDYDLTTHTVSPSGRIHAVRGADGAPWKLTVTAWDGGVFELRFAPLETP